MAKPKLKQAWPADQVVRKPIAELVPYARNARTHTPAQVDQIAASIREWGWTNPVLIDEAGTIIAGHGRVMAAQKLKIADIPCLVASGWTDAQKRAYVLADNQLALNAGWDADLLRVEIGDLQAEGFDVGLMGFDGAFLDELFSSGSEKSLLDHDAYTHKVASPVYEIRGENPPWAKLADVEKYNALASEIDKAPGLDHETRRFLKLAASRHIRFNFGLIAEKYAHAPADVQALFEQSALVVIDFDDAIQRGYVRLADEAMGAFLEQHGEE
jgi:hypothetical protein